MSMRNVNLAKWRGPRDDVALDPASIEFIARKGAKCSACAFYAQWSRVCNAANEEALKRGLKRCSDGVIYVIIEKDPRQIDLVEVAHE